MTSYVDADLGVIRASAEASRELILLIKEFCQIAAIDGVVIEPSSVLAELQNLPDSLDTSLHRDLVSHRRSEFDFILWKVKQKGLAGGVAHPILSKICRQIRDFRLSGNQPQLRGR
jgi:ketopantoate reductase